MRVQLVLFILLIWGCSSPTSTQGLIESGLRHCIDSLSLNPKATLKKTVYLDGKSEEKTSQNVNWEQEFSLFKNYNLERITKKGDLVFDTIYDERTNRYLIRGMRLESGTGAQSLYLVMDSTRRMVQLRISEKEESVLKKVDREVFWDVQGEYSFSERTKHTFAKDEDMQIFGVWE